MIPTPPRIGLTTYREPAAWGVWSEPADLLPTSYADAIHLAGGVPMLLPPVPGGQVAAAAVLAGLDGLLLSGGADVDPREYDALRDDHTGPARADRDSWELTLAREALRRDLPLLGVCRGMQVLAVELGGTLIQHLPDVVGNVSHCPTIGVHGRHQVRFADGSRLASLLGASSDVATYHHQAVDRIPARAEVAGWADDHTVEAFEVRDAGWAVGVQWHPEVDHGTALFAGFIKAASAAREARGAG